MDLLGSAQRLTANHTIVLDLIFYASLCNLFEIVPSKLSLFAH